MDLISKEHHLLCYSIAFTNRDSSDELSQENSLDDQILDSRYV